MPFPAAIAVVGPAGAEKLLVADNLSDDVLLIDAASGAIEKRFDLSESDAVPATFPVALAVAKDGGRAFVALWNASEIVELDLARARWGASWRCSNRPARWLRERIPARLSFRRTERRCTWRWPIAMRLRR